MRRYRKGETFRPPTAAESGANADALEGFRRRSPVPQVRLGRGDKILVKTPSGGIPARVGVTISSAICTKIVETSTAEEKTLLETDEPIEVFNLDTDDVSEEIYVQTGLTVHGTRCVEAGAAGDIIPIELKTDLALFGGATVWHLDDDGLRTTTEETALDIGGFFEGVGSAETGAGSGDKGTCWRAGDGRLKFLTLSCDPPGVNTVETPPPTPPMPDPDPEPDPTLDPMMISPLL